MASNRGRTGPAWDAAKAICFARSQTCARCGHPVDMTLPGTDRWGPQAGHIIDVEDGGPMYDTANLQTEHARCNVIAGNKARRARRRGTLLNAGRYS